MDDELLPEEIIHMIEMEQVSWKTIADQIKNKTLVVDTLFYPREENFLYNLTNYYQTKANEIFPLASDQPSTQSSIAIINWLKLKPNLHPFVKHPLTGKTIWHLQCSLARLLFPCKHKRTYKSLRDLFIRNSDTIEKLTDFSGVSVYNLIQFRKC